MVGQDSSSDLEKFRPYNIFIKQEIRHRFGTAWCERYGQPHSLSYQMHVIIMKFGNRMTS